MTYFDDFSNYYILIIVYLRQEGKEIRALISIFHNLFDQLKKMIYPINYRAYNNIIGLNYLKIKLFIKPAFDLQGWYTESH